jgi:hypothetical protein
MQKKKSFTCWERRQTEQRSGKFWFAPYQTRLGLIAAVACFITACGQPGYVQETAEVSRRLRAVASTNDIGGWAAREIRTHSDGGRSRPYYIPITNTPAWVGEVYPGSTRPRAEIVYEPNPTNDHVFIGWATGRGCWGLLLGAPGFAPQLDNKSSYALQCWPGAFAWHTRRDY